jgi:hypothetical protein
MTSEQGLQTFAIVTGASSGIGEAVAEALAQRRTSLLMVARRLDRLEVIAARLRAKYDVEIEVRAVDLSLPDAAEQVMKGVARVDVLINCAGAGLFGHFEEQREDDWRRLVQLNCLSLASLCREALPRFQDKGVIVNVSSLAADAAVPYLAIYSASKAFVTNLSLALNEEFKSRSIRVVSLNPGGVATEMLEAAGLSKHGLQKRSTRFLTPEQVADEVMHLIDHPRPYWVPGPNGRLLRVVLSLLPRHWVTSYLAKIYQRYLPRRKH